MGLGPVTLRCVLSMLASERRYWLLGRGEAVGVIFRVMSALFAIF